MENRQHQLPKDKRCPINLEAFNSVSTACVGKVQGKENSAEPLYSKSFGRVTHTIPRAKPVRYMSWIRGKLVENWPDCQVQRVANSNTKCNRQ